MILLLHRAEAGRQARSRGFKRLLVGWLGLYLAAGGLWGPVPPVALLGTPAFAQEGSFSCVSGHYYSLAEDGTVYAVDAAGRVSDFGAPVPDTKKNKDPKARSRRANALGVGRGGSVAYALWRHSDGSTSDIYRYRAGEGWRYLSTYRYSAGPVTMIAGGVQFSTSDFYFGGFHKDKVTGTRVFHLYRYLSGSGQVQFVGWFDTGITTDGGATANGDLAFDSAGNLYVVQHKSGTKALVYTVTEKTLRGAGGGELVFSKNLEADLSVGDDVNGAAFRDDGGIVLGTADRAQVYDPADFSRIGQGAAARLRRSSDLASCASPATFVLKKDIVSRLQGTDQFVLEAAKPRGRGIATGSTSGGATGLQDSPGATAGIFPLKNNQQIRFSEVMAPGSRSGLGDYQTTWACYKGADRSLIAEGTGAEGLVQVPGEPSVVVECVLRNGPKVKAGSLEWRKTSVGTGQLLPGSEWELRPRAGGAAIKVVDGGARDTDSRSGALRVDDLPLGAYSLVEVKAPEGYVAEGTRELELVEGHARQPLDLGEITNRLVRADVTWTKTDAQGQPLGGSRWTFRAATASGPGLEVTDCVQASCPAGGDLDARPGYFRLAGVVYGTYSLTETAAPKGYVRSLQVRTVKVVADGASVDLGAVVNQSLPQVSWTKVSPGGGPLGGSTWSWRPSGPTGQAVTVQDCEAADVKGCTGADKDPRPGAFLLTEVEPGSYTLTEKLQPQGYVLDPTVRTVRVREADVGQTVVAGAFVNEVAQGQVTWSKVDGDGGRALGGSAWTLTGPGGKAQVVEDCVAQEAVACRGADQDPAAGGFRVSGLALGQYSLAEKTAPVGYRLDSEVHSFSLDAARREHSFDRSFVNHKVVVPALPLTGGMGADSFWLAGMAAGLLAVLLGVARRYQALRLYRNTVL